MEHHLIWNFSEDIQDIPLPKKFTFPFNYRPHALVKLAAQQLQENLSERDFGHNFGFEPSSADGAIGKMFGVLVVKKQDDSLGFIAAFSGKLADENHHDGFVPPVFDILTQEGYFRAGERAIKAINHQIEALEKHPEYQSVKKQLQQLKEQAEAEIQHTKRQQKKDKELRKQQRLQAESLAAEEQKAVVQRLDSESAQAHYRLKDLKRQWRNRLEAAEAECLRWQQEIQTLKQERKNKSAQLQQRMFTDYTFRNAQGEERSLLSIFQERGQDSPPSGAGECAAPKLLQFAYLNQLKPIAMGEFWWGASPPAEIRSHKNFYPACRSKCEPILGHMLQGLAVEDNPMLRNPGEGLHLEIVYEDEAIVLVNKPTQLLSVPGKNIYDSVLTRLEGMYPQATGPLLVHRLDMSTSGLLLAAKKKEYHQHLQQQFVQRTVSKRYEALLDGILLENQGSIHLPLRVDLDNRPRQLVCYEYGKQALTRWEKVRESEGKTLVHLYPHTGRTHQLRVHCAHQQGLATPIVGDDLYGTRTDRLYLHAAYLKFVHPVTGEEVTFEVGSGF